MKKSILAVVILLLIIASLPSIGNSFIQQSIDERLVELKSFGLDTSKDESISTYLNTSRHFEFVLKDSQNFLNFLNQYSNKQIPPYVNAMLEGVLVGVDIKYSNLPFAKAFEIEIYPIKLSENMSETLRIEDMDFYKYTQNFLLEQGILYHIEYNLLNDDFKGYVKDISESYTLKNDTKLMLLLEKANFKGNGALLAPNELSSKVKELHLDVSQGLKSFHVDLSDFKSSSNFESANTYLTNFDVKKILVTLRGTGDDVNVSIDKFRANASSNAQGETTQLNSKTSISHLEFSSQQSIFTLDKFNFDVALSGLAKKEYLKFTQLISQKDAMQTPKSNENLQLSAIELLSKGVVLDIADFSVEEYSNNSTTPIKGFEIQSKLRLKADKDLVQKIQTSPFLAIPNISLESELRVSKELYTKLQKINAMLNRFSGYEKEDGDDYVFVLKFIDTKASINGKSLN
ncbi:hypothetical protein JHD49_08755 [Sulfurimonas sp. SAG-AH-194-C21]|nr:hypothetical protein [Sulfurimonas sp. SAG-AH-194-C21]MDF1884026.1 hypothetical protein [Sulfurimonas sp. SAG-AH-194-C21]